MQFWINTECWTIIVAEMLHKVSDFAQVLMEATQSQLPIQGCLKEGFGEKSRYSGYWSFHISEDFLGSIVYEIAELNEKVKRLIWKGKSCIQVEKINWILIDVIFKFTLFALKIIFTISVHVPSTSNQYCM